MISTIDQEDWDALIQVLQEGIQFLSGKQVEPVKLKILELSSTAAMLGLEDLAGCGGRFEGFLLSTVAPDWSEEATATLSFAMGALVEKMQMMPYGPEFSAGLGEVLMYLDFYGEDEGTVAELPAESVDSAEESMAASAAVPGSEELPTLEVMVEEPLPREEPPQPHGAGLLAEESALEAMLEEVNGVGESPSPTRSAGVTGEAAVSASGVSPSSTSRSVIEDEQALAGPIVDRLDWYRAVLREDPRSRLFVALAEELGDRGLWSEVAEVCTQGLVYHPDSLRGRVLLGRALLEGGRAAEAADMLTAVHRDLAANADLYRLLAHMADLNDESSRAGAFRAIAELLEAESRSFTFERAVRLPPSDRVPLGVLGDVAARAGTGDSTVPEEAARPELRADPGACGWLLRLQDALARREPVAPVIAPIFDEQIRESLRAVLEARRS